MGNLSVFLKGNKVVRQNYKYVASQAFKDENGNPVEWELRPITTKERERIEMACTTEVPVPGKPYITKPKTDYNKFMNMIIAAAVVYPNLNDTELQDSYGVMGAEELVTEMLDDYNEHLNLFKYITDVNGLSEGLQEKVDKVKN